MTSPPQSPAAALIKHLHSLVERDDRGGLAALRRGLGKEPGTVPEMYRHVEPYVGSVRREHADAAYLVASLFGLHPAPWHKPANAPWNTSFGWSVRRVRFGDGGGENEGVIRRFTALLSCERGALPTHLRQLLTLLHGKEPNALVNWERLFWDVVYWEDVDRRVQRSWAEAFWRGGTDSNGTDAGAVTSDDDPSADEDES